MRLQRQGRLVRDNNGIPLGASVLVRIPRSHRKRYEFERRLGRKPQYLFSYRFAGHFTWLSGDDFERLRPLVTRARVDATALAECWNGKREEQTQP